MARLTGKALAEDIANTVLEDSEPERQAEEAVRKQQEMQRREQKQRNEETKPGQVIGVVEASTSSPLSISKGVEQSVIEISDTSNGTLEAIAAAANAPRHGPISSQPSEQEIQDLLIKSPQSHQVIDIKFAHQDNMPINFVACITSSAEPESPVPKLDIARFAFGKKAAPARAIGYALSKQFSHASTEESVPATKAPKTKPPTPLPLFASSFTTTQLTALSKCFVCDVAWTVRKTVPVKMAHIKNCGRKNGWHEETIIARMTKEIGLICVSSSTGSDVLQTSKKSKGKGKAVADQPPKTFLEDVVNDAAPRKRRKKARDLEVVTVLNPQDAHAAIMERAKTLLRPPAPAPVSAQEEVDSFPTTQIFSPSKLGKAGPRLAVLGLGMLEDQTTRLPLGDSVAPGHKVMQADISELPPSTQACRPSALAGRPTKQSALCGDKNENGRLLGHNDTTKVPATTQTFRPSALSAKLGKSRLSIFDMDGTSTSTFPPTIDNMMQAPPSKPLKSTTKPLLAAIYPRTFYNSGAPSTSTSVSDELYHLPATSQKKLEDLNRRLAEIPMREQDGAVQLDPNSIVPSKPVLSERAQTTREANEGEHDSVGQSVSKGKKQLRDSSSSSPRSRPSLRSRSASRKPHSRHRSRSPRKSQQTPEEECGDNDFCETLDKELYRIIKEDKVLYERILRYEPIRFDVFSKLAGIQEMDGRGFKLKLRGFLDRQAINFYGDSASFSNRRRYK